ncbi:hypothetical protein SLEP1_g8760 [Rubroshorea leprosula]|uniref:Reverse transcriptase Ty1/copia-type domain-containing protein n=1 Tax=Rubroshorea leprosula TaxID=152421 RepID=A0AAV5I8S8_9ROSI|nr:hypothetical protein SLEP1_g8760 [Rubroshorea leprosula]
MVEETPKTTESIQSSNGKTVITTPAVTNSSSNNIMAFVAAQFPVKLTSDNYTMWSRQFTSLLRVYRLTEFLQGTRPCPPKDDLPDSPYDLWVRQDQSIQHAILTSVSESVHPYVSSAETSHEAWVILERLYANSYRTRVNALKKRLQNLRCEGRAVTKYLRTAKILIDQIRNAEKASIQARDKPPLSFEDLQDRLLAHEESLQREEALVNDNNTPITAQFAYVHPRIVGNHNSYGGFSDRNSVGGYHNSKGLQEYSNRPYRPNSASGTNQYVPMGHGGGRGHRGARGGKNNRNSFNKDCPELKNHANVANFATTSTSKKGDWWIDFGASDHVTPDLANLALHSEYDGPDELLIGDGSADTTLSQARPRAATPSVSSSEINQVCSLNSSSSSHSAHDLTSSPILLPTHRSTTPPIQHCSPLRPIAQSSPPTKPDTTSVSHQPTSTLPSSPATSSQLMPTNATSLSPFSNATTDSPPTPQPPPVPSYTHGMITRSQNNIFKPKTLFTMTKHPIDPPLEPTCVSQALKHHQWRQAMSDEFNALVRQGTWELVPSNNHQNVIGCKWVFRIKRNNEGRVESYKARLVAKGFHQRPGSDYFHTFSPVIKPITIRIVLSLALNQNWPIRQLDVNNAFLHGKLEEELFMAQPPGFVDASLPQHAQYILDLLDKFGMAEAKPVSSPMATTALQLHQGLKLSDPSSYRSLMGSLQHLNLTRPDITFAVNHLSQFLHAPSDVHMQAAKRILRYLKGTPISWKACKQKAVAHSSTEAEYRALAAASSEVIWVCEMEVELNPTSEKAYEIVVLETPSEDGLAKLEDEERTVSAVGMVFDSVINSSLEFYKGYGMKWQVMIKEHDLVENQWLKDIFEEREMWAPPFLTDQLWAGMSSTQRSEGLNDFFDGFVH